MRPWPLLYRGKEYINVRCFAVLEDAQAFMAKFGGELIALKDRPRSGQDKAAL